MHAEIVVTGSELLLGETVDTNSCTMARLLRDIGLDLYYKTTVGDNRQRLAAVVSLALERSDIVLVSGGLGPTVDDVTREAVSDATGRPLVFHPELLDQCGVDLPDQDRCDKPRPYSYQGQTPALESNVHEQDHSRDQGDYDQNLQGGQLSVHVGVGSPCDLPSR